MTAGCRHERGHIADWRFHGDGYALPESRRNSCDVCRMQRWLDVEATLARSRAQVRLMPADAADAIARAAAGERIDLDRVQAPPDRASGRSSKRATTARPGCGSWPPTGWAARGSRWAARR